MKHALEIVERTLKIVTAVVVVIFFSVILFFPGLIVKKFERIITEFNTNDFQVELSFFGLKVSRSDEVYESLAASDQKVSELQKLVACLQSGDADCNGDGQNWMVPVPLEPGGNDDLMIGNAPPISAVLAWIVISGADRDIDEAAFELKRLDRLGYSNEIIFINGWYRSVAVFSSRQDAEAKLSDIRKELDRKEAYIRLLSAWCAKHERKEGTVSYVTCEKS